MRKLLITTCFLLFSSRAIQAQWVQTSGPGGAGVNALLASGTDLFAGTDGGVYFSSNNGTSWTALNAGLPNFTVRDLVVSGTNLFAATLGVFRSTTNGNSWTAAGLSNILISTLLVFDTDLIALSENGSSIYRTSNNGISWTETITNFYISSLVVSDTNLFAESFNGYVYLSTDKGTSWDIFHPVLPTDVPARSIIAIGTDLYISAGLYGGTYEIFRSSDNGNTWTAVVAAPPFGSSIAVSGMNLFAGNSSGVSLSTDNGTSWTVINTGLTNTTVNALAAIGTNLFAGTDDGVYLATKYSSNWTASGLTNTKINTLAVNGENLFAGTEASGVLLSTNNGVNWNTINTTGLPNEVLKLFASGTNLYANARPVNVHEQIYRSIDNGASWNLDTNGLGWGGAHVLSFAASGTNIFIANGRGVFRSSGNGTGWTAMNTGLPVTTYDPGYGYPIRTSINVLSLAVSGTNIFAGTDSGVFLSTNNGVNWTATNFTGFVSSVAVSGPNLFAFSGDLFLSTDNGTSWKAVGIGLPNGININAFAVSGTNLFAGAGTYNSGVFLSTNSGTSWNAANTGLGIWPVTCFAVSGTGVFAGTSAGNSGSPYTNKGDVFRFTDNLTNWSEVTSGMVFSSIDRLATSGASLFAATQYGGAVFRSTNNGQSWNRAVNGLPQGNPGSSFAVSGSSLFVGNESYGVFLSNDNGTSWNAVNTGLTSKQVRALAVSGTNLFAGTYNSGVFLSTNYGTSWNAVNTGLTNTQVFAFAVSGTNLFAGTLGGVFRSTNNGSTWSATGLSANIRTLLASDTNLFAGSPGGGIFRSTNNGISWAMVAGGGVSTLGVSGSNLFAGTDGDGVFLSTDNGTSWQAVNTGLSNKSVSSFAVNSTNLFVATHGGGVYSRSLAELDPPYIIKPIADVTLPEDFGKQFVARVDSVFSGPNPMSLFYTTASSDEGVMPEVSNDSIYIISRKDYFGAVKIAVTTSNDFFSVSDTFIVTVNSINDAPIINALCDTVFNEDFGKVFIRRLSQIFSDADNISLNLTITSLSAGVTANIANDSLYLVSGLNFNGSVGVRLTASDGQYTAVDTFQVFVNAINDPPFITRFLRDTVFTKNFGSHFVYKLSLSFSDVDDSVLIYDSGILGSGLTSNISHDSLFLNSVSGFFGNVSMRITATDGDSIAADTILVVVVNNSPIVYNRLRDTTYIENFGKVFIRKLPQVFLDADDAALTYRDSTFGNIVTSSISNDSLYISSVSGSFGNVNIRVTASDGNSTVADTFSVTVIGHPSVTTSIFQNPASGKYADIVVLSTIGLNAAPGVSVTPPGASVQTVSMSAIGGSNKIYLGSYLFVQSGSHTITNHSVTVQNYDTTAIRTFNAALVKAGVAVSVSTLSGKSILKIREKSLSTEGAILAFEDENAGEMIYEYHSGSALSQNVSVGMTIDDRAYAQPEKLFIFQNDEHGVWNRVETTFLKNQKMLKSDVLALGKFKVVYDEAYSGSNTVIKDFALSQNYPNPFNPTTTVRFDLPEDGKLTLVIYNILGQRVRTLFEGSQTAGRHEVIWDGRNETGQQVSSGIYLYRLQSQKFTQTRKMLLVK